MPISITEAIETLTLMGTPEFNGHTEDILKARKLGIEALKRITAWRNDNNEDLLWDLPGETID